MPSTITCPSAPTLFIRLSRLYLLLLRAHKRKNSMAEKLKKEKEMTRKTKKGSKGKYAKMISFSDSYQQKQEI